MSSAADLLSTSKASRLIAEIKHFLGISSFYMLGADFIGTFVAIMAATKKSNAILQDKRHVQLRQLC
jgi:hypothetical protein